MGDVLRFAVSSNEIAVVGAEDKRAGSEGELVIAKEGLKLFEIAVVGAGGRKCAVEDVEGGTGDVTDIVFVVVTGEGDVGGSACGEFGDDNAGVFIIFICGNLADRAGVAGNWLSEVDKIGTIGSKSVNITSKYFGNGAAGDVYTADLVIAEGVKTASGVIYNDELGKRLAEKFGKIDRVGGGAEIEQKPFCSGGSFEREK